MVFSLIIGTLNRSKELEICLSSLVEQVFKDFEVIIIDQSDDDNISNLVKTPKFNVLNIIYKRVNFRGLSKARNFGLSLASGKYFALIDDDAAYEPDYLYNANIILETYEEVILSGYMYNKSQAVQNKEYQKVKELAVLSIRQIIRMAPSPALIFPMKTYNEGIRFDEKLGVGALFGACEETDFILEGISKGYKVIYSSVLKVEHPTITHTFEIENTTSLKKKENYAMGLGALIKKEITYRNVFQ